MPLNIKLREPLSSNSKEKAKGKPAKPAKTSQGSPGKAVPMAKKPTAKARPPRPLRKPTAKKKMTPRTKAQGIRERQFDPFAELIKYIDERYVDKSK